MKDEPNDTSEQDVTDNVELSEDDDLDSFDYFDPDDDQDDDVAEVDEGTDDEADETETPEETDGEDDQEADDKPQASEIADDVLVTLPDGTAVKFGDLKESPMLKADHTRKTQAVAQERDAVKAETQRIQNIQKAFVDHISQMMPAEPDASLALSDPNKFVAQKAQYDAALGQLQKIIEIGEQAGSVGESLSQADQEKQRAESNAKLLEMFPETGTEKRAEFFKAANTAALEVGFSAEELGKVTDPRLIALAHWAQIGKESTKAAAKAKAKVQAAPAAPRKPGVGAKKANTNVNAMRKLSKTGSIHDALQVDWD